MSPESDTVHAASQANPPEPPTPPQPGTSAGRFGLRRRCAQAIAIVEANAGSPQRTATALALGVFLSFSPFLGLQILIGLGLAFAFRLSRIVVLIGLCANLPWIMVPWYTLTTAGAAAFLGGRDARPFAVDIVLPDRWWAWTGDLVGAFFWPFIIGPTVGAAVLGVVVYAVSLRLLRRRANCQPATPPSAGLSSDTEE